MGDFARFARLHESDSRFCHPEDWGVDEPYRKEEAAAVAAGEKKARERERRDREPCPPAVYQASLY